jgi:glycosyltransferase involved in cell wall biosynthesis
MDQQIQKKPTELWIIVPVFNERDSIEGFHKSLVGIIRNLSIDVVICYVDDGSTDGTDEILERWVQESTQVRALRLSRNFGHQAALTAGLQHARGDVVITMDGDGQHPPELIPQMIQLYEAGHGLVLTRRVDKRKPWSPKWLLSSSFYWILSRLSETSIHPGSADFRLMSRQVVDVVNAMPEYHRFLRGLVSWIGFNPVILPYVPAERIAGASKYSLKKMARLALDAIFSFSLIPLWLGLILGFIFVLLAGLEGMYVLSFWLRGLQAQLEPGWSSLMFVLLLVGGSIMVLISIMGIYIGYILQEVKGRPVYIVQESLPPEKDTDGNSTQS